MPPVPLSDVLNAVLAARTKHAEIQTNAKGFFVHVRVPDHVASALKDVQERVLPANADKPDIDHVTLVYTKKALEDHPPEKVHAALDALRQLGERTSPIDGRIQGWAYFDGAGKDGKPATALVALLDAPGLDHLHVDMARALADHGIAASDTHVFNPHITIGYLPQHGRVEKTLPPLSGSFAIDKVHVAARDHHEIPLTRAEALGQKAASAAWRDRLPGGLADAKKPSDFDTAQLAKGEKDEASEHTTERSIAREIAMDHLTKDPDYYRKNAAITRDALVGAGLGGGLGALTGLLSSSPDQPLGRRMLLPAAMGAVGGGLVGATHHAARPSQTSDLVSALDQERFASLGEAAAKEATRRGR